MISYATKFKIFTATNWIFNSRFMSLQARIFELLETELRIKYILDDEYINIHPFAYLEMMV